MSDDAYKLDTKNLDDLMKALKSNLNQGRVGILGNKNARGEGPSPNGKKVKATWGGQMIKPKEGEKISYTTNASIGALHEFGVPGKLPMRSFLRVPISTKLRLELENSGAFKDAALKEVIKSKSMRPWLESVVNLALKIVSDAFDTGGDGKWPKWSKGYSNNTGQILVDTQQLRNSITGEVK